MTLADIVDPGRPVPESVLSPEDAEFLAAVHGLRPDQRAALAAVVAAMR